MATSCKFEFQAQHFGFVGVSPHQFYHIQWTQNRWVHLVLRFLMFGYQLAWFIVDFTTDLGNDTPGDKPPYLLLSNWTEWLILLYFTIALIVSIVGVALRHNDEHNNSDTLCWYHKVCWAFFNMAVVSAFIITIFYWAVIGRNRPASLNLRPRTIHLHVTNSILALIEIFVIAAVPTRLLHFVYTIIYGVVYGLFGLIMHWTGVDSQIYSVLDWQNSPGTAAGWLILAIIIMPMFVHAIVFGFYHLRACIARATVLKGTSDQNGRRAEPGVEMGNVNPAFMETPQHKPI